METYMWLAGAEQMSLICGGSRRKTSRKPYANLYHNTVQLGLDPVEYHCFMASRKKLFEAPLFKKNIDPLCHFLL